MKKLGVVVSLILAANLTAHSQAAKPSKNYRSISKDGAWCWFSDPRAVSLNQKIYAGWVTTDGSIMVGSYDEKTGDSEEVTLFPQFNQDDHANPALILLPDRRLMVFFSAHSTRGRGEKEPAISYAITQNPEDITAWGKLQRITQNAEGPRAFCYNNPVMLSEEDNRIYIFWRGGDWKPTFCYTDDRGKTWSKVFTLIKSSQFTHKRPYMKIASNGKDEIHFAFTDGHPRNEPLNSIYYVKYRAGKFYSADGRQLGAMDNLPLEHEDCDLVYDAPTFFKENANGVRAWIWDVAVAADGTPVIAYARLPAESEHEYWYARWDGQNWKNYKITEAGSWFPRYKKDKSMREPEPHYSGGVYLDHEQPNIVYYSKPVGDIFEIFKAESQDGGETWQETPITVNSNKDNVRPFAIRGGGEESTGQLMWMLNKRYSTYKEYKAQIKVDLDK